MAQGLGNTICGFLGLLPVSGVIVRSAAGIGAGSKGREASIMHGLLLLMFVVFCAPALRLIPVAGLAAVLVYTGIRLVNLEAARGLAKFGRVEQAVYVATLGSVVATDLLTGILVGFTLSALRLVYILTHCECEIRHDDVKNLTVVDLKGSATFFTLPSLTRTLEGLPPGREVHLFVSHLDYIDHACLEYILGWEEQYIKCGGQAFIEWDRLVRRFNRVPAQAPENLLQGYDYDSVVARAVVLELPDGAQWPQMVDRVTEATSSVIEDETLLRERLSFKIEEGGGSFSLGTLMMGLRLPNFRRHELVAVRCPNGLSIPDPVTGATQTIYLFLLLIGSQERPDEHLKMMGSVIARLTEDEVEVWQQTESADELRQKLLRHKHYVKISLEKGQPSEIFIEQAVWQLGNLLPRQVLIVTVERNGASFVPKGADLLKEHDEITVLGAPDEIERLYAQFAAARPERSAEPAAVS